MDKRNCGRRLEEAIIENLMRDTERPGSPGGFQPPSPYNMMREEKRGGEGASLPYFLIVLWHNGYLVLMAYHLCVIRRVMNQDLFMLPSPFSLLTDMREWKWLKRVWNGSNPKAPCKEKKMQEGIFSSSLNFPISQNKVLRRPSYPSSGHCTKIAGMVKSLINYPFPLTSYKKF